MTDANSRQVALQNLREFQEMSYSDVYALIRDKRFAEATAKYKAVLENMDCEQFNAALNLKITTPHDKLLSCMSQMASDVAEPDKIRAVSFDLSSHAVQYDESGYITQGIEVSLYSQEAYNFLNASDAQLKLQCESPASEWQGCFMEIDSCGLEGLGPVVQQFQDHAKNQNNLQGIIENEDGVVIVDPVAIARHVAKLLVAVEYHRYMADFVSEVEVPSQMVFIIGEHDEIEVPILFYRVGEEPDQEASIQDEVTQELQHEETPTMYHSAEADEDDHVEEPKAQPQEAASMHLGGELYEVAKRQSEQTNEPEQPIDSSSAETELPKNQDTAQVEQALKEEQTRGEKAMLGKSLGPKPFGQRSNEIFDDEDGDKTSKEKSA